MIRKGLKSFNNHLRAILTSFWCHDDFWFCLIANRQYRLIPPCVQFQAHSGNRHCSSSQAELSLNRGFEIRAEYSHEFPSSRCSLISYPSIHLVLLSRNIEKLSFNATDRKNIADTRLAITYRKWRIEKKKGKISERTFAYAGSATRHPFLSMIAAPLMFDSVGCSDTGTRPQ